MTRHMVEKLSLTSFGGKKKSLEKYLCCDSSARSFLTFLFQSVYYCFPPKKSLGDCFVCFLATKAAGLKKRFSYFFFFCIKINKTATVFEQEGSGRYTLNDKSTLVRKRCVKPCLLTVVFQRWRFSLGGEGRVRRGEGGRIGEL